MSLYVYNTYYITYIETGPRYTHSHTDTHIHVNSRRQPHWIAESCPEAKMVRGWTGFNDRCVGPTAGIFGIGWSIEANWMFAVEGCINLGLLKSNRKGIFHRPYIDSDTRERCAAVYRLFFLFVIFSMTTGLFQHSYPSFSTKLFTGPKDIILISWKMWMHEWTIIILGNKRVLELGWGLELILLSFLWNRRPLAKKIEWKKLDWIMEDYVFFVDKIMHVGECRSGN